MYKREDNKPGIAIDNACTPFECLMESPMQLPKLSSRVFSAALAALLAACASGAPAADGERRKLVHDGIERSYVVRAPKQLTQGLAPVPLVLVLHGGGGNAANAERMTGFTDLARKQGFLVVYPEGSGRLRNKLLTWNAGHCCGYAMTNRVDDAGFINALIDRLIADYPVDVRRIYATGMSNGGMMTHRLGIELSNRFAAIAPVVATLFGDEIVPPQPVSALMINGMLDKSVPYLGGPPGGRGADAWDGTPAKPAQAQAEFWAQANRCERDPEKSDGDRVLFRQYRCPTGKTVAMYLVKDNGHAWPGGRPGSRRGDEPSTALNATEVIWRFFRSHPK